MHAVYMHAYTHFYTRVYIHAYTYCLYTCPCACPYKSTTVPRHEVPIRRLDKRSLRCIIIVTAGRCGLTVAAVHHYYDSTPLWIDGVHAMMGLLLWLGRQGGPRDPGTAAVDSLIGAQITTQHRITHNTTHTSDPSYTWKTWLSNLCRTPKG